MKKSSNKTISDLQRLLMEQNFQSEEELQKFMESLIGKEIPSFPFDSLDPKEQAKELIMDAYDLSPVQARVNIEQALQLDINCIDAYILLGLLESVPQIGMVFFEKGIAIGRSIFDKKYRAKHKGHFWGLHETRPFMRCLQSYAECLFAIWRVEECVAIYEELIELNPNDSQGVVNQLMHCLITV
ncbi:MAG TPA: hypothetical protein DCM08_05795, partial [Microscillaceae bacterium]|nr:hypothetical protein [Microscillaceae bacterium]